MMLKDAPAPPPGFVIDDEPAPPPPPRGLFGRGRSAPLPPVSGAPTGQVHDGDTFRLSSGPNARLFGVDAFELDQPARTMAGTPYPIGVDARAALLPFAKPTSSIAAAGAPSYGRPVVTLNGVGGDAGENLISKGLAVPDLRYLAADQPRADSYIAAQRQAIAGEAGAYAGSFQTPQDYRKQGEQAPWTGKILMRPGEAAEWERLIRNPRTTADQAGAWLQSRGHSAENVSNLIRFLSRNPDAEANPAFQQRDAAGNPVQPEPRGLMLRAMDAINEGIIDVPTAPFDLSHAIMKPVGDALGIQMGDSSPIADWMRDQYHGLGFGQRDEGSAPRSDLERYAQSFLRGAGSAAIPVGGSLSLGGKLALRGPSLATEASAARTAIRDGLVDAAKNPGTAAALEIGSGAGSYVGEEAANDLAPGNPYAAIAGQVIGGLGGGFAAGAGARRFGSHSSGDRVAANDASDRPLTDLDPAAPMVEREGVLFARTPDGRELAIPTDPSGHPGVVWTEDGWQALVSVDDGAPGYGPVEGGHALPSRYADLARQLNGDAPRPAQPENGVVPPPPPGFDVDSVAAMDNDMGSPSLAGPRVPDRIDLSAPAPRPTTAAERAASDNVPDTAAIVGMADQARTERAGNINLANLDSPQNIDRALQTASDTTGGFADNRRGVVSQAETERLAGEMGMTADDLLRRRKGQALNAEQALAARQILAKSGDELITMAQRVQALENPGDELLTQFRQAWVRHVAIQEQVSGATAEAGRALSQFRMMADSRLAKGQVLSGLVHEGGGADRLKDAARILIDSADDPGILNSVAARTLKPKFSDKLVELWYNSLLSGPQTHAVNIMSNTLTSLAQIPEHIAAAGVGAVRRALPSQRDTDAVLFSEVGARAAGLLQGAKEGLAQSWRTFRTGEPSDFMSKVETRHPAAISGIKGSVIRTPTRALAAEDELFKAMARRMELSGLAFRQAAKEGLKGNAAKARVAELMANPTDDMLDRAFKYGQYLTFQSDLGPIGQGVTKITQSMPVLKLVLPFIKTPTNLLKFTIERSPAAPILKEWRTDFRAGGDRRDLAVAKAMVGSGMMALVTEMVAQGAITGGGPADEGAKSIMRADGWQPYSVKIGDRYYSYQRMDPFSSTIGIAADLVDLQGHMTEKQRDEMATLLVAATLKNLSNKTWLSGITDLTEAINDPDRSAQRFLARMAGSIAVPAGVAQIARTTDPVLREAKTELDRIRSRIPGMSQSLLPKRDVWGQPIVSEGGLGPDIVSPVWTSTARNDPINRAMLDAGAHVGQPKDEVYGRKLSPQEFGAYRDQIGRDARGQLGPLVASPTWAQLPIYERQEILEDVLRKARRGTREGMFGAPPGRGSDGSIPPPPGFVLDK